MTRFLESANWENSLGLSPFLRERLVERLKDESHVK